MVEGLRLLVVKDGGGIVRVVFGLNYGGRQMLGLKSRGLVSPKHEGEGNATEVYMKVQKRTWEK
jgi:hypothetical protein